jgi:hypothetical protein
VPSVSDVGDNASKILSSFLLLSPGSPSFAGWLVSFERVLLGTKVGEVRTQKPQDAAHCSFIIILMLELEVEQNCVIKLQYTIESAHVGSEVGTTVGSGEGCLEGRADGEIVGDAVGFIVALLQVPQDKGQSLWILFLILWLSS